MHPQPDDAGGTRDARDDALASVLASAAACLDQAQACIARSEACERHSIDLVLTARANMRRSRDALQRLKARDAD